MPDLSRYAKFVTALIGAAALILTTFFPGRYDDGIAVVIALATALGVYLVPNKTTA